MNLTPKLLTVLFILSILISCKKEKTDDTTEDRFIGLWVESNTKKDTLVVTKGAEFSSVGPMLFLHSNGESAIPFSYRFNNTSDSIVLSELTASSTTRHNVPYKITLSDKVFTINKFHSLLPDGEPLSFYKVR